MSEPAIDQPPQPRDAASLILVRRDGGGAPRVLMGQRGSAARFMPSKFVFPGGALDPEDRALTLPGALQETCARRLAQASPNGLGLPLALSAVRETFEETGLALGLHDPDAAATLAAAASGTWQHYFRRGVVPCLERLRFVFRAVTPPTRPVRFDARFFLADAADVIGDLDDFSEAEEELAHLQWLTLSEARELDLPFITTVVLAEVEARLATPDWPADRAVPYFRHETGGSFVDPLD
jgi:8-oxo-dGTP pyrophosphatase MutT (NUDIX family)